MVSVLLLVPSSRAAAGDMTYSAFRPLDAVLRIPGDIVEFGKASVRKDKVWTWVAIAASTAALIPVDGRLYDESVEAGKKLGIQQKNDMAVYGHVPIPGIGDAAILTVPKNLGASLYFLGDGWFHISFIVGFLGYGGIAGDNRALGTASDLFESMVANGIVVQAIKISTSRENPNTRETPNGRWRWFVNPVKYFKHVNKYDAFPSGHLPTALSTVIVISENYPDSKWIKPVGYALMVPLAYQMVNSGVHWYSDYPLAIYMGYTFAHIVTGHRRARMESSGLPELGPVAYSGGMGLGVRWNLPQRGK